MKFFCFIFFSIFVFHNRAYSWSSFSAVDPVATPKVFNAIKITPLNFSVLRSKIRSGTISEIPTEANLSPKVHQVIQRAIKGRSINTAKARKPTPKISRKTKQEKPESALIPTIDQIHSQLSAVAKPQESRERHQLSLQVESVRLQIDQKAKIKAQEVFQVKFLDDQENTSLSSQKNFVLEYDLLSETAMTRSAEVFINNFHSQTITDLALTPYSRKIKIPAFEKISFFQWARAKTGADEKDVRYERGHLVVALAPQIDNVDIDASYFEKRFLDSAYREITNKTQASFVIFTFVSSGNVTLSTKVDQRLISKSFFVSDEEIFYTETDWNTPVFDYSFKLKIQHALGAQDELYQYSAAPYDVSNGEKLSLKATGHFSQDPVPYFQGANKYFAFRQDKAFLFSARNSGSVSIPDKEVESRTYQAYGISELWGECLIQINLPKDKIIINAKATLRNGRNDPPPEILYLNNKGQYHSEQLSGDTTKIFLKAYAAENTHKSQGKDQLLSGTVHVLLHTSDGEMISLKSFCLKDQYLVEQL